MEFKNCFNAVKKNHLCTWYTFVKPFSVSQIIKMGSLKTKEVKIKSYDHIKSLLEDHCTFNADLIKAITVYSLRHALKMFLN